MRNVQLSFFIPSLRLALLTGNRRIKHGFSEQISLIIKPKYPFIPYELPIPLICQ